MRIGADAYPTGDYPDDVTGARATLKNDIGAGGRCERPGNLEDPCCVDTKSVLRYWNRDENTYYREWYRRE